MAAAAAVAVVLMLLFFYYYYSHGPDREKNISKPCTWNGKTETRLKSIIEAECQAGAHARTPPQQAHHFRGNHKRSRPTEQPSHQLTEQNGKAHEVFAAEWLMMLAAQQLNKMYYTWGKNIVNKVKWKYWLIWRCAVISYSVCRYHCHCRCHYHDGQLIMRSKLVFS